jgi:mediator of RNA polymerase II transcription subunit 10
MTALNAECKLLSATASYANVSIAAIVIAEGQLKDIVQNLYNLIVQAYDHHGNKTQEVMKREM